MRNKSFTTKKSVYLTSLLCCFLFVFAYPLFGQSLIEEVFTTSGTFTVPNGVTAVTVEVWGAGVVFQFVYLRVIEFLDEKSRILF